MTLVRFHLFRNASPTSALFLPAGRILLVLHLFPLLSVAVSPHMNCHDHPDACINYTTTTEVPKISGVCLEHCNAHRVRGNINKYLWDCSKTAATNEQAQLDCSNICDSCPYRVCDSLRSPYLFHCPPMELETRCIERCDTRRPSSGGKYELNCFKAFRNTYDREVCETECQDHCSFICTKSGPHSVFQCPAGTAVDVYKATWFIAVLIIFIPAAILLIIIILRCFYHYKTRSLGMGGSLLRQRGEQSYQQQLTQDPFNVIATTLSNEGDESMAVLTPSEPRVKSSVTIHNPSSWEEDDSLSTLSDI